MQITASHYLPPLNSSLCCRVRSHWNHSWKFKSLSGFGFWFRVSSLSAAIACVMRICCIQTRSLRSTLKVMSGDSIISKSMIKIKTTALINQLSQNKRVFNHKTPVIILWSLTTAKCSLKNISIWSQINIIILSKNFLLQIMQIVHPQRRICSN